VAHITSRQENGIAVLTIENEPRRNAFTHEMTRELERLLLEADRNPAVRCIVITGAGDAAFSSGHDLREMLADRDHASDPQLNAPFLLPASLGTPTIAAVNGYAYAAGFILAISCDLRVCAANASFGAPGAHIGLLPIGWQLSGWALLMARGVARDLLSTGGWLAADEAFRLGFANRLAERGEALGQALEIATAIAGNSAGVLRAIKSGLQTLASKGTDAAANYEWEMGRQLQSHADAAEGINAFLEKRAPNFV